jgi:hypothetical protein
MGGAIFNMFNTATANLTNCTLANNSAQGGSGGNGTTAGGGGRGLGGAIFNLDGTLNLTFCTLANNTVTGGTGITNGRAEGAAVYNLAAGSTIGSGNPPTASTTLTDSILANSASGTLLVNDVRTGTGTVTLNGPNRVTSTSGTISGTPPLTANPLLGPLQNNGGPTPTMALQRGSPFIGAGIPVRGVTTDQRGFPRPAIPSLGAFEPQPSPPPPPAPRAAFKPQPTPPPSGPSQQQVQEVAVEAFVVAEGILTDNVPLIETGLADYLLETGGLPANVHSQLRTDLIQDVFNDLVLLNPNGSFKPEDKS